jgi:hypothetical protein
MGSKVGIGWKSSMAFSSGYFSGWQAVGMPLPGCASKKGNEKSWRFARRRTLKGV